MIERVAGWLGVAVLVTGCGTTSVHVLSPSERYDHNRTRPVCIVESAQPLPCTPPAPSVPATDTSPAASATGTPPQARMLRVGTEHYAPQSVAPYHVQFAQADTSTDALPPAQLVPIFTGVALPLSAAPIAGCGVCVPDRADLTDYLASGPGKFAGVDAPDTQGDVTSTAAQYRAVLDLLSRRDFATLKREQLKALLDVLKVKWADEVLDSRYPPAAFTDVLAFRSADFWFVLYRFPEKSGFTRLVVVPTGLSQNPKAKRPSSEPMPEEVRPNRGDQ